MLKECVNWEVIKNINNFEKLVEILFIDAEILAKYNTKKDIGVIFKFENNKIVLLFSEITELTNDNIINILENNSKVFDSLSDAMNYLRDVRFDHAINYDMRNLSEPLLGELYKNRKVNIKDILGV